MGAASDPGLFPFSPCGRKWMARSARRMRGRAERRTGCDLSSGVSSQLFSQWEMATALWDCGLLERQARPSQDRVGDTAGLLQDLVVPEANDSEALAAEPVIANGVRDASGMLRAVAFHDEPPLQTAEVRDVPTYGNLTSPLQRRQTTTAQQAPELSFGIRVVRAQRTGEFDKDGSSPAHQVSPASRSTAIGSDVLGDADLRSHSSDHGRVLLEPGGSATKFRGFVRPLIRPSGTFSRKGRMGGSVARVRGHRPC